MSGILKSLTHPLTTAGFDTKAGQLICWIMSCVVLVLGFLKLATLKMNEAELFFGLLLVTAVALLLVLIGLVLPSAVKTNATTTRQKL